MAQPVWVLSVDLQTKTAAFQSGMAEAAKSARGAFSDIKEGSGEMGREMGGNMMEARHSVMMLGEEFGVHLPRALVGFITSLGPIGAAMEAAFPFMAIILGATLLAEALHKIKESGEKLTEDQEKFGTTVQEVYNSLDKKILESGIRADELRGNHLGALAKQLELIDKQSMAELAQQFGVLAKAADVVFEDMKSHWYTFGKGGDGAKHSLDTFKTAYDEMLAHGDSDGALKLLDAKVAREKEILRLQEAANAPKSATTADFSAEVAKEQAVVTLRELGVHTTKDEIDAQRTLVDALNGQVGVHARIAELKKLDDGNAKRTTAGQVSAEASTAAKAAVEANLRMGEQTIAADRATANARLQIQRASIQERMQSEIEFADRELALQMSANQKETAALDKYAKDYPNQLKAMHEKAEELTAQHGAKIAEITAKAAVEQNAKDIQDLESNLRAKIEATKQGSAARLAALDEALKQEAARNLQDTSSYRDLLTQRVEAVRQAAEEEAKLKADMGREAADNAEKMGALALAAQKEHQALLDSGRRVSIQQRITEEVNAANQETALKMTALSQQIAALDKSGKDYENKLRELQDKQKQLVMQHENEITAIKDKAETERNSKIMSAETRFNDQIAQGLSQVLMGHKSFSATMTQLGNQVVSGMLENAIKSIMANDMSKESDAAAAARKAYLSGMKLPFPANMIAGPAMGALAFAAVMAFENGTDSVPGIGRGDRVPAMLEPGEGVVPGGVMDGLRNMARSGSMGGGPTIHVTAHYAPQVNAVDSDGVQGMLDKHGDKFQKHIESALRRTNH